MFSLTCGIYKNKNRNRLRVTENKLMVARGKDDRGKCERGKGGLRYKLPVMKLESHREVIYSIGNIINIL